MSLKSLQEVSRGNVNLSALQRLERAKKKELLEPRFARYKKAFENIKELTKPYKTKDYSIKDFRVQLGEPGALNPSQEKQLIKNLEAMMPWRKGPFDLFDVPLDAEWRSDLKWERLKKAAGPLQGRVVLDIGCNNGYYLYLMAKQKPRFVLGIDPTIAYYYQYQALKQICTPPNTHFTLHGVDDLVHFDKAFDVVFCLGIVYHHTDPIGMFRKIFNAMRPGALLIVESMGVSADGPFFLFPSSRYLGMPGHWFIPSREALENLLRRAGFQYIETFFETPMEEAEQRRTRWAPYESYTDGLDPSDASRSKEGYPAPIRLYVKARRARVRR